MSNKHGNWGSDSETHKTNPGLISRRRLLQSIGLTGAAAASTAILPPLGAFGQSGVSDNVYGLLDGRVNETPAAKSNPGPPFSTWPDPFADVKRFGAAGDGVADDTTAVQAAISSLSQGGTVVFPKGTYRITSRIEVNADHTVLLGQGFDSKIVYTYEQTDTDTMQTASLFVFRNGIRDIQVRDMQLQYTGTFFPEAGDSYKGLVNGLKFSLCFDVLIHNVEIHGFNASGIEVMTGNSSVYGQRITVHQCHLHHNRVAGIWYGNVEYISITDCDLNYNGSVPDGATGYGCAGAKAESPRHIQVIGNRACFNYRKGIDLHAGVNAVIEGNLCHGNRLYGIYTEGRRTGNVLIKGNVISGMKRATVGLASPYNSISGISFGVSNPTPLANDFFNFVIEGNLFTDFGIDQDDAFAIQCYFDFANGTIQIRNNVIRASRVAYLVRLSPRSGTPRNVKVDISGNQMFVDQVTQYPFLLLRAEYINIQGNQITINNQPAVRDGIVSADSTSLKTLTYMGNQVVASNLSTPYSLAAYSQPWMKARTIKQGNFLNLAVEPD
ncbi:glycosyl hydrolase family 28-related protein [Paenibacillus sp. GYB004]|uniref:right-handed parallel beta-helix repeat-containing protein n=1 Tax=Paenibacillus sp. GYB004 TaxID=2994393 RepID=UPI002F967ABD